MLKTQTEHPKASKHAGEVREAGGRRRGVSLRLQSKLKAAAWDWAPAHWPLPMINSVSAGSTRYQGKNQGFFLFLGVLLSHWAMWDDELDSLDPGFQNWKTTGHDRKFLLDWIWSAWDYEIFITCHIAHRTWADAEEKEKGIEKFSQNRL